MSGNIMSVIETGIISNGIPVFTLDSKIKLNSNLILRSGYLSALQIFIKSVFEDETQELYSQIKIWVMEIDNLKIEKVKEEKRHEKIGTNKEELIDSLKQEFGRMNVEVI